jgi:hypothetical protein
MTIALCTDKNAQAPSPAALPSLLTLDGAPRFAQENATLVQMTHPMPDALYPISQTPLFLQMTHLHKPPFL